MNQPSACKVTWDETVQILLGNLQAMSESGKHTYVAEMLTARIEALAITKKDYTGRGRQIAFLEYTPDTSITARIPPLGYSKEFRLNPDGTFVDGVDSTFVAERIFMQVPKVQI